MRHPAPFNGAPLEQLLSKEPSISSGAFRRPNLGKPKIRTAKLLVLPGFRVARIGRPSVPSWKPSCGSPIKLTAQPQACHVALSIFLVLDSSPGIRVAAFAPSQAPELQPCSESLAVERFFPPHARFSAPPPPFSPPPFAQELHAKSHAWGCRSCGPSWAADWISSPPGCLESVEKPRELLGFPAEGFAGCWCLCLCLLFVLCLVFLLLLLSSSFSVFALFFWWGAGGGGAFLGEWF